MMVLVMMLFLLVVYLVRLFMVILVWGRMLIFSGEVMVGLVMKIVL